jgi:hypothetical protein
MSIAAMAGPIVDASAGERGVITPGAQTIYGPKTFADKVVIGSQAGGNALELDGADYIGWPGQGTLGAFGGMLYSPEMGFRTQNANGLWIGGVLLSVGSAGLGASAGSFLADVTQTQASYPLTLCSYKGGSAGVVTKIGTQSSTPHASAELLRVGHSLGTSLGSDGVAVLSVFADGRVSIASGANSAYQFAGVDVLTLANDGGIGLSGNKADNGVGQAAVNIGNGVALTEGGGLDVVRVRNGGVFSGTLIEKTTPGGRAWCLGGFSHDFTDDGGSAGNKTQNTPSGRAAMTSGTAAITITSNKVAANDHVSITWEDDPGIDRWWVTYAAGSFVLNTNANVGANKKFRWSVIRRNN